MNECVTVADEGLCLVQMIRGDQMTADTHTPWLLIADSKYNREKAVAITSLKVSHPKFIQPL